MSTINNTIKTILLITSILLLNACSDDKKTPTAITIEAPRVLNVSFY